MEIVVQIENLVKYYGDIPALLGVTFSVRRGEAVAYLGPNGSGKTTTIKIMLGLLRPTSGHVEVLGVDVTREPDRIRGRIGYVQQLPSLELNLSVEKNLELYARLRGIPRHVIKRKVSKVLEELGLSELRQVLVSELSLGQRRLVQIARELVCENELLVLDEPTTGLDPVARRIVLEKIREYAKEHQATVFLTSHIPQDIELLCKRVLLLVKGKLRADMSIEEFKQAFGGLRKIIARLSHIDNRLIKHVQDLGLPYDVHDSSLVLYADSRRIDFPNLIQTLIELCRRAEVEILDLNVQEPSMEDAIVRAYTSL